MITIKPTTIGSLILELPYCTASEATAAGFSERPEGHERSVIEESEFEDFLEALVAARSKARRTKKGGPA